MFFPSFFGVVSFLFGTRLGRVLFVFEVFVVLGAHFWCVFRRKGHFADWVWDGDLTRTFFGGWVPRYSSLFVLILGGLKFTRSVLGGWLCKISVESLNRASRSLLKSRLSINHPLFTSKHLVETCWNAHPSPFLAAAKHLKTHLFSPLPAPNRPRNRPPGPNALFSRSWIWSAWALRCLDCAFSASVGFRVFSAKAGFSSRKRPGGSDDGWGS